MSYQLNCFVLIVVVLVFCLQSRALQNNAAVSPFRRWGQSSFRTRQTEQHGSGRDYAPPRRASSSESDFYLKVCLRFFFSVK